jgi:O-antigen/teichoic acid export membrane protein
MASRRVVAFVVTIIAAVMFRSYWALVIGSVTGRVTGVVMSYVMHPYRPRFALSRARELFSFSGWILVNNMAGVLLSRLPQIYVGRVFGAQALGAYAVGSEISQLAHTELVAPINRAMFPGYARLVGDPDTFRRVCIEATAAILLIVLPVSAALAVLAAPIVRLLLGWQWPHAVPIIQILTFAGAVSAVNSNNTSAYLALGKPHLATLILVTRLVVFAGVVVAFAPGRGVEAVAYAELAAAFGCFLISLPILLSSLRLGLLEYLVTLWRPLLASAIVAAAMHKAANAAGDAQTLTGAAAQLIVGSVIAAVLYPAAIWFLWWLSGRPVGVETMIGSRVRKALSGFLPRRAA